jgi:hypothetical protein
MLMYERRPLQKLEARLAKALGEEGLAQAQEAGGRMSLDEALSAAQELLEGPG